MGKPFNKGFPILNRAGIDIIWWLLQYPQNGSILSILISFLPVQCSAVPMINRNINAINAYLKGSRRSYCNFASVATSVFTSSFWDDSAYHIARLETKAFLLSLSMPLREAILICLAHLAGSTANSFDQH